MVLNAAGMLKFGRNFKRTKLRIATNYMLFDLYFSRIEWQAGRVL